jgi:recombination protein RecA
VAKKSDLLAKITEKINNAFGKGAALVLGAGAEMRSEVTDVIPTGIDVLDHYVLGIGGLPCGRVVELYSEEGGGKTSLLMAALAGAQREDGLAVLEETENALQSERLTVFGVDQERLLVVQPDTLEEALQEMQVILESLPKSGKPTLIGWDSLAATPPKEEVEGGVVGGGIDPRARILSKAFRQIVPLTAERNACVLIINQTREKIGVVFGNKTTTPGGMAVKFAASIRLQILGGKAVKVGESHAGKDVTIIAAKNRLAPPWRKARVRLRYDTGWDNEWSTLEFAKDLELIEQDFVGPEALLKAREKLMAVAWDPRRVTPEMHVDKKATARRAAALLKGENENKAVEVEPDEA